MTDEELLEEKWGRVLVHESGHALMAVLKGIHCHGIYYDRTANQFPSTSRNTTCARQPALQRNW